MARSNDKENGKPNTDKLIQISKIVNAGLWALIIGAIGAQIVPGVPEGLKEFSHDLMVNSPDSDLNRVRDAMYFFAILRPGWKAVASGTKFLSGLWNENA